MASTGEKPIPEFSAPPVMETVLGVEFARLENWAVPYFGIFWNEVKEQFPKYSVKPPLDPQVEQFDKPKPSSGPQISLLSEPEIRCLFIDSDDRTLIQVQGNRFTYNWLKTGPADSYPHYNEGIRPAFERAWGQFSEFVQGNHLGQVNVVQCEVTYINHLEVGKGWHAASDLAGVFPCWLGKTSGGFLPPPENVGFDVIYRIPNETGRLRVSMKPAIRNEDGAEILQLTLTARGKPAGSDLESVLSWLDMGRQWVVRGFTDFTSSQMHRLWERST